MASLRPKLKSLPGALENVDWDSGREERRRYIESRTRRFLDERKGELGDGGEGAVEGGRRRGADELASLEGIVGVGERGEGRGDVRTEMDMDG